MDSCVEELLEAITIATDRITRALIWTPFGSGVYMAELPDTSKFLFIHRHAVLELHVADTTGFHKPVVVQPVDYGADVLEKLLYLGDLIDLQAYWLARAQDLQQKGQTVATEQEFVQHIIQKLS